MAYHFEMKEQDMCDDDDFNDAAEMAADEARYRRRYE